MADLKPFMKHRLNKILKDMLGSRFITSEVIDLPQIPHIQVFVKTTEELIWGETFQDDPASAYLEDLGYHHIDIIAAKEFKGGLWYGYED
jgi:hypothetical protein